MARLGWVAIRQLASLSSRSWTIITIINSISKRWMKMMISGMVRAALLVVLRTQVV